MQAMLPRIAHSIGDDDTMFGFELEGLTSAKVAMFGLQEFSIPPVR